MPQLTPSYNEGRILSGQQLNPNAGFVAPFVEVVTPYYEAVPGSGILATIYDGDPFCEITPIDAHSARVRIYDTTMIEEVLAATNEITATTITRIDLPDELLSITVVYNSASGSGTDSHPASQQSFIIFGTGSGGLSPSSSSQGSGAITPDLQVEIRQRYLVNVAAMQFTFYLPSGATMATIIAKLVSLGATGVLAWPSFHPESHTFTLKGQQISVAAKADTSVSGGGSLDSGQAGYQYGGGTSIEIGLTTVTKTIPPTIHGAITITGTSSSAPAAAGANASTPILFAGSPAEQPAITNGSSISVNANASVSPTSLAATTPATIPTSGLYIYSVTPGPSEFGQILYTAIVVDFGTL